MKNELKKRDDKARDIIDAAVVADIPVELSNNLTLLARKLAAYLSYFSAASLTRLNTLNKFISEAEDRLYNVDVQKLDIKELNARYKEAKRAQADNTARVDEIYNLLKSLSADTLSEIRDALVDDGE